jgi:uncharacterized membrane protein
MRYLAGNETERLATPRERARDAGRAGTEEETGRLRNKDNAEAVFIWSLLEHSMTDNPQSTAHIAGHPLHPILIPFPIVLLVGGLFCDPAFWSTGNAGWTTAAYWSIGLGILAAGVAAVIGLIDFMGDRRIRDLSDAWQHFLANGLAVVLAILNFYLRYRYGAEQAVFRGGILMSALVVLLLLFSGWKGGELVFRYRVAVLDNPRKGLS